MATAVFDIPLFVISSALAASGVKVASLVAVAAAWTSLVSAGLAVYATVTTEAGCGVPIMAAAAAGSVIAMCLIWFGRIPTRFILIGPFAFRPAPIRSKVTVDVACTLAQLLIFWGSFLVLFPGVLTVAERRWELALVFPPVARPVGVILFLLAGALGVVSAISMSTKGHGTPLPSAMPNRLVVVGPYRWIRNPMAVAGITQGAAVGLLLSSWLVIVYAVAGSVMWNYAVRPIEESDLEARFGNDFRKYRETVRCWLPRIDASTRAYGHRDFTGAGLAQLKQNCHPPGHQRVEQ